MEYTIIMFKYINLMKYDNLFQSIFKQKLERITLYIGGIVKNIKIAKDKESFQL